MPFEFRPGSIQSPADPRDWLYSRIYAPAEQLPARVSLRDRCPPMRDQGRFGTCCGQAGAGIKGIQEAANYPGAGYDFSPLYIYSKCKELDGIPDQEGTYPRTVMKVLKESGSCFEQSMPYSLMSWPALPAVQSWMETEAGNFRIVGYAAANTLNEVKQSLTEGNPVFGAIMVCENMVDDVGPDGFVGLPTGKLLGGHAITVIGYDDQMRWGKHVGFLEVRNSWGVSWGDSGYCWIPYDYFIGRSDIGMAYWPESWTSVDVITPPTTAKKVELWIGKDLALVDGREVRLSQPAVIDPRTNRALLPVRFLSEQFGYSVDWDRCERKITLKKVGG